MKLRTLALSLVALVALSAHGQTALHRARVGHGVEDLAYVAKGALANQVVVLDGWEVFAVPANGGGAFKRLFDLRDTGGPTHVNGITWLESEKLFAIVGGSDRNVLYLVDASGRPSPARTLVYPSHPGETLYSVEALATVPQEMPIHAGHAAEHMALAVSWNNGAITRITIFETSGEAVGEIVAGVAAYGLGLEVVPPDRLLLTTIEDPSPTSAQVIYTLGLDGQVVAPPVWVPDVASIEGLARTRDGRIAIGDYFSGRVRFLDASLSLLPSQSRNNPVGLGLGPLRGLAWDSLRERHVVLSGAVPNPIHNVNGSLDEVIDLAVPAACGYRTPSRLTYVRSHGLVATATNDPANPAIVLIGDGGAIEGEVELQGGFGRPQLLAYVESRDELAVVFGGPRQLIRIFSSTGVPLRTIDLGAGVSAVGLTAFETTAGGRLLVATGGSVLRELDLEGALIATHDLSGIRVKDVYDLSTIDSGPFAGAFGLIQPQTAEVVVFRLD